MHKHLKYFKLLFIVILFSSFTTKTPIFYGVKTVSIQTATTVTWSLLGQIDFVKKKDRIFGEIMSPLISPNVKKLQGKKIIAQGYIVPIDNKNYALSKNVFAKCFFCGNAGPETIMGIKFKGATPKLKTDTYVTIEGTFRYNDTNLDDWIYHIENAVITAKK